MIRTTITPDKQTVSFDVPKEYRGRQIEVIAFAKDEGFYNKRPVQRKASFTVLHVNTLDHKFNRDEASR